MRNNILLPTDFSDNAWSSIVYAMKLFAEQECTFYLFHSLTLKLSTMSNMTKQFSSLTKENAMKELLELKEMAEVSDANSNHRFEIILSFDELTNAIETEIIKNKIDLVVIGTKGAKGVKEFFFGSNSVKIIKKMRLCPVLIVPDEFDFVEPKQIALSTDFNRFFDDKELKYLKLLADMYNLKIRIVHIKDEKHLNDIQKYNIKVLKDHLDNFEISFHWMPDYTKKAEEIKVFIEDLNIDLLVMVNYKHSLIEYIFNEPVIKKIGYQPIVPFLVVPE
ncbi:MAG: universal stress protein [Flavobacteriaceae bacterium]